MIQKILTAINSGDDGALQGIAEQLKSELVEAVKVRDASADFEKLPALIQYYLSMKAEMEFMRRSIERQMKLTSVPRLLDLVKSSHYISSRLIDIALESTDEYGLLSSKLSQITYLIETLQSGISGLWVKRDALVHLSALKRRQIDAEKYDF